MRGGEDQAQEVVAEGVVDLGGEIAVLPASACLEIPSQLRQLARMHLGATQAVHAAVARCGHQPGARVVRDA